MKINVTHSRDLTDRFTMKVEHRVSFGDLMKAYYELPDKHRTKKGILDHVRSTLHSYGEYGNEESYYGDLTEEEIKTIFPILSKMFPEFKLRLKEPLDQKA